MKQKSQSSLLIIVAALLFIATMFLTACGDPGPTCAERGGHREFSHMSTTWISTGKVMFPINNPVYKCVIP